MAEAVLTLDWLGVQGACPAGRDWFASRYPQGVGAHNAKAFVIDLIETDWAWAHWLVRHSPLSTEYLEALEDVFSGRVVDYFRWDRYLASLLLRWLTMEVPNAHP